jgi:hypothetical protein
MGQELEMDRWAFRDLLIDLGMPVAPAERIIGVDDLEKHLEKIPEAYIKSSATRGDWETYHHISPYSTRLRLTEFRHQQGPLADDYEFIVELPIETDIEMGGDHPFVGEWPALCEWGYEMKDLGFAGTFSKYEDLPEPIRYVDEKMAAVLREFGYAGSFSSEVRVKGKDFFFTDPTARMGSPPSQLFWEMCGNWPERMWYGAEGKVVEPVVLAKYGFMAMAYSSECDTDIQWYGYPEKLAQWYKFSFSAMIDGQRYSLPQRCGMPFQAYITAMDDDPTEAIKKLVDHSRQLKGDGLDIRLECLLHAVKQIRHASRLGFKFGDGKLPTIEDVAKIVTA